MGDGYGLSNSLVDKAVSTAQQRMEEQGFEARRELMKYDKVLASQRTALYSVRDSLLQANTGELQDTVSDLAATAAERVTQQWLEGEWIDEDFDTVGLKSALAQEFGVNAPVVRWVHTDELEPKDIRNEVRSLVSKAVTDSVNSLALPVVRAILLSTLDRQWVTHLTALDELRASIGLRAMAQQNPVYAFAEEGKRLFAGLRGEWATTAVSELRSAVTYTRAAAGEAPDEESLTPEQRVHLTQFQRFVTRNEPCPCGSGKRFKFCHGVL
jgi:preprotein translocase subunit SecA